MLVATQATVGPSWGRKHMLGRLRMRGYGALELVTAQAIVYLYMTSDTVSPRDCYHIGHWGPRLGSCDGAVL